MKDELTGKVSLLGQVKLSEQMKLMERRTGSPKEQQIGGFVVAAVVDSSTIPVLLFVRRRCSSEMLSKESK